VTAEIFQVGKDSGTPFPVRLFKHQQDALALAAAGRSYVVTTGTGSGKSLSFFIPIVDRIIKARATDPRLDSGDHRVPDERAGQQPGGGNR
jgi:ATP-dependent helicase YprA (DUF1998 family)